MMACAGHFHALAHQPAKIKQHTLWRCLFVDGLSRLEYLLHRFQQTIRIVEHEPVKLFALGFLHFAALQGLEIKANRSNRRLQFVSDRIDEAIVLLIALDFADEKNCIENQSGGNGPEKDDAEKDFNAFAPVEDNPTKADGRRDGSERHP